jgi:type VI secretion system secreted protein VgrG
MMGFMSNTTKGGGGYNEIVIRDGKAGELVRIHAQKDMDTTVRNNDTQHVIVDRKINVDGKHNETVKGDMTTTVTEGNQSNTVSAGNQTNTVSAGYQHNTAEGEIKITSNGSEVFVKAATKITLEVGASKLVMDSGGNIELTGTDIKVQGKTIASQANGQHTIRGGKVEIN